MSDPQKKDLSGIIALLLIVVVALALTPTITDLVSTSIAGATNVTENLTGAAAAIVQLVPLFWIIMIIAVALVGIKTWLQN